MTKVFVDSLISHMKKADIVAKASPWMNEGYGDKGMSVRYVGIKLIGDWLEVFSPDDNFLIKFVIDRTSARAEYYLANTPPFLKIISRDFQKDDKWETMLGEVKRRLKKDKGEYLTGSAQINNIYSRIKPHLK